MGRGGIMTYDVYFGTVGNLLLISAGQSETSLQVPYNLEYNTEYEWRVDAVDLGDTVTGTVWSFTTLVFDPPVPTTENNMVTTRYLVAVCDDKVYYEI
jgi:hypothetical protein